jgi:hypothetical protein
VTGYKLDNQGSTPGRDRDVFLATTSKWTWGHPAYYVYRGLIPRG